MGKDYRVVRTDGGDVSGDGSFWFHSGDPLGDATQRAHALSVSDPENSYRVEDWGGTDQSWVSTYLRGVRVAGRAGRP